jgi:uncharacterized membrane protein YjdF
MVANENASPAPARREPALRLVAVIASLVFIAMSVFVAKPGSNYRFSALFLVPIVWAPYLLRRRLFLHPFHYVLFTLALLLHNLGAFGLYQRAPLGLSFDIYVHFYFGVVGGLMLYRYLGKAVVLTTWQRRIATVLLIIGMGAIHELVEWFSTLILGPKNGMLKTEGVYQFDTQRDMFDNLVGAIVAVTLYAFVYRRATLAGRKALPKEENGDWRAAAPPAEPRLDAVTPTNQ